VIATRHDEHAAQVRASLNAGKHVFVEKPLALNWQELNDVITAYRHLDHPPLLLVGFNRRFAPALQHLKEALRARRSPLMVNYRLNGGYIPLDHWIHGSQGGGRNLGEACHVYDVFRFLADAPVASIDAVAIDPGTLPYARNDNFSAVLRYENGSVCNLLYTALGPKQGLSKERVEVFCDGEAYLIDDFRTLVRTSDGAVLWQSDQDKGHGEELLVLGRAIRGEQDAPIPFDQIIETTAVSLHIEDLLHGRTYDKA
jgi:predicted dehydrogenase